MLEDGGDVALEDEVAEPHERVTAREEGERPPGAEREQDHGEGTERPADADVKDVVDRVPVVLAVRLGEARSSLDGGRSVVGAVDVDMGGGLILTGSARSGGPSD